MRVRDLSRRIKAGDPVTFNEAQVREMAEVFAKAGPAEPVVCIAFIAIAVLVLGGIGGVVWLLARWLG